VLTRVAVILSVGESFLTEYNETYGFIFGGRTYRNSPWCMCFKEGTRNERVPTFSGTNIRKHSEQNITSKISKTYARESINIYSTTTAVNWLLEYTRKIVVWLLLHPLLRWGTLYSRDMLEASYIDFKHNRQMNRVYSSAKVCVLGSGHSLGPWTPSFILHPPACDIFRRCSL
jgi:hypothetical protein